MEVKEKITQQSEGTARAEVLCESRWGIENHKEGKIAKAGSM